MMKYSIGELPPEETAPVSHEQVHDVSDKALFEALSLEEPIIFKDAQGQIRTEYVIKEKFPETLEVSVGPKVSDTSVMEYSIRIPMSQVLSSNETHSQAA